MYKVLFLYLFVYGYGSFDFPLHEIWIPKSINWKSPSFATFYFYENKFIKITSTQSLNKDGTINLISGGGFILSEGYLEKSKENVYVCYERIVYRSIELTNEKLPQDYTQSLLLVENNKFRYHGEQYEKTKKYTEESKVQLDKIKNDFIPSLLDNRN